ncbi:MAG: PilZ domain-containing protein [Nitrospiraceae bacterium]|nr:MAG: PilZ domain-containing protein [Nitrospiraceae bacterium]
MNQRKSSRYHVELRCTFVGDGYSGKGTVLDLSMEGCRVHSDTSFFKGAYIELFVALLGQIPPLPIELAVIRWSAGPLSGLEFIRIADGHHARLRQYVQDLEQGLMASVPGTSTGVGTELGMSER